jgi:diguanylate cyclase (GGDEF)-like protein
MRAPEAPWLGPYRADHDRLFGERGRLGSVALLPLMAQGCLVGSLNLGSRDPARYAAGLAVDFHSRLASVASVCLQNAINRERLIADGHTDALTGWSNRRYLEQRLPQEIALAVRHDEPLSCLVLDVDHFKQVNDRYGHAAGDSVLRQFADCVREQLRTTDLAVRYGGEEFVVFLIRTGEADARRVAERIRRRVAAVPFRIPGDRLILVTTSGGIAALRAGEQPNDAAALGADMLRRADAALYRAKSGGRNRIV